MPDNMRGYKMIDNQFSWISAYEAIATKLLEYEGRQEELCDLVNEILGERYQHMDPLTFFSMFNGRLKEPHTRRPAIEKIKERLSLDVEIPDDFKGIPRTFPMQWLYWDESAECVDNDWKLFRAALAFSDSPTAENQDEFTRCFDVVRAQKYIGDAKLSMALFWIRPKSFLSLDSNMPDYLREQYGISVQMPLTGETYLTLMEEVREKTKTSFVEISAAAFQETSKKEKVSKKEGHAVEEERKVNHPKNLILYGPPGTGKTYRTRAYAVAICDDQDAEHVLEIMSEPDGFTEVTNRYNQLVKEGRVGFTTFHQSYGYEEFIEGLRPEYDEEKGIVTYPLRKGAFRAFCEAAEDVIAPISELEGIPRFEENPQPRVWKVGLRPSNNPDLLERCREEGAVRIGWDNVGVDEVEESDKISERNRRAIIAFQEEIQPGDFIVVPGAKDGHYGVAVITGEFEWDEEFPGAKRRRAAQWLSDISKVNFLPLNDGRQLTLQTVYELSRVTPSSLLQAMVTDDDVKASLRQDKPYVFIIDEINRGNVSKVFGELITVIEPTKRKGAEEETLVRLSYSGKKFGVPENVYMLGTMNTADRSIALMDTALRRRFDFVDVMPEPEIFDGLSVEGVDIAKMLSTMNKRIELLYDREHTLGHAYLMKLLDNPYIETLAMIFETKLIPLLQEYFFDDYGKIRAVLGAAADRFVKEHDGTQVFWGEDRGRYDRLRSYEVLPTPQDAEAYELIYAID